VQVDVGQKRGDHRFPAPSPLARRNDPVFQDTRFEPFTDQADDEQRRFQSDGRRLVVRI
jgi:hypothetical protein